MSQFLKSSVNDLEGLNLALPVHLPKGALLWVRSRIIFMASLSVSFCIAAPPSSRSFMPVSPAFPLVPDCTQAPDAIPAVTFRNLTIAVYIL